MITMLPQQIERAFSNGLALEVMRIQRHGNTPLHTHGFSELVIILQGRGVHISPAGDYPIGVGDVFVLHGNQVHGYRDTVNLDLVNILFCMDELAVPLHDIVSLPGYHALFTLEPLFRQRDKFESRLRLTPEGLAHVTELLQRLERESHSRRAGWRFAVTACFMLLMADLCREYSHMADPAAQPLLRLGRVIGYIEQYYSQTLTLDLLADIGDMSRRTLTREFRRAMNCSPIEYLIRLRINHAAAIIKESEQSLTDIAFSVGFLDSNYFARQFRIYMGCSPRDYRNRHYSGRFPEGLRSPGKAGESA